VFRRDFFSSLTLGGLVGATASNPRAAAQTVRKNYKAERFTCKGCALGLEVRLRELNGVKLAYATYPECDVVVEFDDTVVGDQQIKSAAEELGYLLKNSI